jgi:hypothetical protein
MVSAASLVVLMTCHVLVAVNSFTQPARIWHPRISSPRTVRHSSIVRPRISGEEETLHHRFSTGQWRCRTFGRRKVSYFAQRSEYEVVQKSQEKHDDKKVEGTLSRRGLFDIVAVAGGAMLVSGTLVGPEDVAVAADTVNRINVYPGGNNIKSLRSMGGLPKKIRSICVIMVR